VTASTLSCRPVSAATRACACCCVCIGPTAGRRARRFLPRTFFTPSPTPSRSA